MARLAPHAALLVALTGCFVDITDDAVDTDAGTTASTTTAASTTAASATAASATAASTTAADMCLDPPLTLAMTPKCVLGSEILSAEDGHARCMQAFGEGWRWLDHHEQGGWSVLGTWKDDIGVGERGWILVDDSNCECFSSTRGVTWLRLADTCAAGCGPGDGLEGPDFLPHSGQCNPYQGDTPCDLCRRLICAK